ncbi:MAG: alpha/beta hydrolase fold domain-containing protein [Silvibacterium sp.]|nr:alpha/beta hydrolase fold domain-containing protein [Silvibacterium sp.]MBV8437095.1 alpha/beta hydrolase fold domain-containing protein [Silvibacterium sp.]
MHGFPPAILTTGIRDLLLSNTVRVHHKLREAGVDAQLEVFEGQSHAQYQFDDRAPRDQRSPRRDHRILRQAFRSLTLCR